MMTENNEIKVAHQDAALKGVALGVLTFIAAKVGVDTEVIAVALPFAVTGLSWVSTKIGDKNTTLLLNIATKALSKKESK
jgi:hypothetical protein